MRLDNIDLGGTDAESDAKLERDFFETGDVAAVINGREFILLGRKGAGKSSLFRQLPILVKEDTRWDGGTIRVLNLTPENYEWNRLATLEMPNMPPEALLTSSWRLTLYLQIADDLLATKPSLFASIKQRQLRAAIRKAVGRPRVGESVLARAVRILDSFSEGSLGASEAFSVSFKRRENSPPAVRILDLERRLDALLRAALPAHTRFIVQIDRLDDVWDGAEVTKTWLIGLLKAVKALNDSYRGAGAVGPIKAVVYLRTDIYETLQFDDKDKLRSFEKQIIWDEESLAQLIQKRLPDGLDFADVFENRPISRTQGAVQYFFDRTFLRPREIIQFLQECLTRTSDADSHVSHAVLKSAEIVFSTWKVEDLKAEFAKANPQLPGLIEALRQGKHRYDSIESIANQLRERAPKEVDELGERGCLQLLFNASVIGVRLNESGKVRFRVNEPTLQLPSAGSVYVHPGLQKALLIVEARSPRRLNA